MGDLSGQAPNPDPKKVAILEPTWWMKLPRALKIDPVEEFHRLTLSVKRTEALASFETLWIVVDIPRGQQTADLPADSWATGQTRNP